MRLIDADALKRDVKRWFAATANRERMKEALDSAPTIEAEPVRHGEWRTVNAPKNWGGATLRCSECNTGGTKAWSYCPNCGSKMDGGAEDGKTD